MKSSATKSPRSLNFFAWLVIVTIAMSDKAAVQACPAMLFVDSLPIAEKYQQQRDQLRMYALVKNESGWFWRPVPMQLDPYDDSGRILFPDSKAWRSQNLTATDRISFSVQDFTEHKYEGQHRLPCGAKHGARIDHHTESGESRFAYLFLCEPSTPPIQSENPVRYEGEKHEVSAKSYRYVHDPKNHLMFRDLSIRVGDEFRQVAYNSDQLIRGDVRRFLTLNFGGHEIQAQIFEQRDGPLGIVGLLRFYLRILVFQIELSLTPEVQFFPDALFMPMSLHIPVEAQTYLNPGSGVYYTWQSPPEVEWDWQRSQLLEFGQDEAEEALTFCRASWCHYVITGSRDQQDFSLRFLIPRNLVDLGFYPQLLRDMNLLDRRVRRNISRFSDEGRIGFFFETTRLPRGNHDWDFWLHFGSEASECPAMVRIRSLPRSLPLQ